MGAGAGPRIPSGLPDQFGPHRISLDIGQVEERMFLVGGARVEAVLPEVAAAAVEAVEILGVEPMASAHGLGQGILAAGHGEEVDMVAHQAVAEEFEAVEAGWGPGGCGGEAGGGR